MAVQERVDADSLWRNLEGICRWERYTGTAGENAAVRYVEAELTALGIDVEVHAFHSLISIPGETTLRVLGAGCETIPAITAVFGASTGAAGVSGQAAYVGEAGAPDAPFTDPLYTGASAETPVAGRVVVAEGMLSPGRFHHFERRGAVAQVYVNKGYAHELTVSTIWGAPTPESIARLPTTPVVTLSREQGAGLLERLKRGEEVGLRVDAQTDTAWRETLMPVASIMPDNGSDEYVLVGGHIDSWHIGANDNGAGDATLMELARIAHEMRGELRRGLKIAWWNGHSHGRFSGSTWYADHMFGELRRNCAAYLNIDQPGCRGATLYRPFCTADIRDWVQGAVSRLGGQDTQPDHPRKMADQSLWGVGVPSFSFLPVLPPGHPDLQKDHPEGGFPEYWHHPADTLDKMDKALLAEHCRLYAAALHELCTLERVPLNPATTAAVVNEEIGRLDALGGGAVDLGDLREAGARFARACAALNAKIEDIDAADAGRALLDISHAVNPVLYTLAGPFDHDPASGAFRLPGLQCVANFVERGPGSDAGRVIYTRVLREKNRIIAGLGAASAVAEAL
ncbi:MAG: M28 family peptidase [Nitrospinae bacterium]|nr:M28 family peptidase [Nitrospinota bacterium]